MEIKRDIYLNKLIRRKHNGMIKVVTGLRRCGKSYLVFKLFRQHLIDSGVNPSHIIEIAFDDFENEPLRDPHVLYPKLKGMIADEGMHYILLDEVQLLTDFEAVLNGLIRMDNADVYVTGSNARFLSKDIITEFRGRGDEVHMYPLSFAEFMSAYPGGREAGFDEYMAYGGLPMMLGIPEAEDKSAYLKALFEETYVTDIVNRHGLKNRAEMEDILNILSSSIGSLTNPSKLSATFKSAGQKSVSATTIKNYIDFLCDSFLIDSAMRYDIKGKKYINTPVKYYFTDMGLRNARLNFRQVEPTHAMENIIFNELKVRGFNVDIGIVTINATNANGNGIRKQLEIDFVCNLASRRYYIQSAFSIPDGEKLQQEQRSLTQTGDSFKKIIISRDVGRPHYNDDGILMLNIFDFLLDPHSLEF